MESHVNHESAGSVVRHIYDAFGRGDLAAVLARIDPDATLQFEGPSSVPWTGVWSGRDGWTRFFTTLGANLDRLEVTMEPFAAEGERVVAAGRYRGVVRTTGRRIDSPLVHLWTVRSGLVTHCIELTDTASEAASMAG
jgi:ketosteroid isomerase-like protein